MFTKIETANFVALSTNKTNWERKTSAVTASAKLPWHNRYDKKRPQKIYLLPHNGKEMEVSA